MDTLEWNEITQYAFVARPIDSLRKLATDAEALIKRGEAYKPVNAAVATVAFGKAAQCLHALLASPLIQSNYLYTDAVTTAIKSAESGTKLPFLTLSPKAKYLLLFDRYPDSLATASSYLPLVETFLHKSDSSREVSINFEALARVDAADIQNRARLEEIFGASLLATKESFEPSKYADSYEEMVSFAVIGLRLRPLARLLSTAHFASALDPRTSGRTWWLLSPIEVVRLWDMHKSGASLAMFMDLASILDRAMRDLLNLSGILRGSKPPVKFYDLMKLAFFQQQWGLHATIMINVFLGTMEGINLRNLLWHGFLSHETFDPAWCDLLVLTLMSLPKPNTREYPWMSRWSERGTLFPLKDLNPFVSSLHQSGTTPPSVTVFPDNMGLIEKELIHDAINHSFFLVKGQEPIVWQAFTEFLNGAYFASLLMMLPLIEHGLRKIYLFLHDCPGARGVKLDSLLNPRVDRGAPNLLYNELPQPLRHALFDLFVWREDAGGIRNLIAHGVTADGLVPKELADRCFAVMVSLCLHYLPNRSDPKFQDSPLVKRLLKFTCEDYRPSFHPRRALERRMSVLAQRALDFLARIRTPVTDPQGYLATWNTAMANVAKKVGASMEWRFIRLGDSNGGFGVETSALPDLWARPIDYDAFATNKELSKTDQQRKLIGCVHWLLDAVETGPLKSTAPETTQHALSPLLLGQLVIILISFHAGVPETPILGEVRTLLDRAVASARANKWAVVSDLIQAFLGNPAAVIDKRDAKIFGNKLNSFLGPRVK